MTPELVRFHSPTPGLNEKGEFRGLEVALCGP